MWRLGMAALAAVTFAAQGQAAEFKIDKQDGKTRLLLTGKIMPGDAGKFVAALKNARSKGDAVTIVVLNSSGGSGPDSINMAKAVREAKMATSVPAGAVCTSGCFIVFAGGIERTTETTSRLGVHVAGQKGRETEISGTHTLEVARFMRSLDVPPAIVGKLIMTPHKEIALLSVEELRSMNVTIGGVSAAAAAATTAAFMATAPSRFVEARAALERGDTAGAIQLMKLLAEQGDSNAQAMMGAAHERLKPPDLPGSVKWFRLAANQDHPTAQYYVGLFYETGTRGVPRDRVEAYKWLTLSVRRGNIYAPRDLSRIEKQMTADELTEGKKRVSEWKPSSPASPVSAWSSGAEKWPVPHASSQSLINTYGARRNDREPVPTPAELKAMEAGIP